MRINLIKSSFFNEKETKHALCDFIEHAEFLSINEQCASFEKKFAEWQGRKHCILFNSGSSANLALIQALLNVGTLQKADRVGFSAITWATNVMPLLQLGLHPVPVDIKVETLNASVAQLERRYAQEKFSCLFITNLLGFSDDISAVQKFCEAHNILLIEDNCEALGSEYQCKKLGNFGFASTFSFFVGHHLSTVEGGAVCTDDDQLAVMLRMVRSHGWDRHLTPQQQEQLRTEHAVTDFYAKYTFYYLAYNLRPTEIQGFLGLHQLRYLDETIGMREKNYSALEIIYKNPDLIPIQNKMSRNSNFAFPIVCKNKTLQHAYIQKCNDADIEVRPIVGGLITEQPFYKKYVQSNYDVPNSKFVHEHGFYVGNNPEMTVDDLSHIMQTLS